MRSTRLLIVLPAATALVFTGLAPASANDNDRDRNGRLSAEVTDIDRHAQANDRGTRVRVTFDYECRGDDDDITTRVVLKQRGARFDTKFDGGLYCNGREHSKTVVLRDSGGRLENGDARVTVRFDDGRRGLDDDTESVRVRGVDRDDDRDRDRDNDRDKEHHGDR
jgi:hypothetical protein